MQALPLYSFIPFMTKLLLSLSEVQLILESHWSRKLCKLIFKFENGLGIKRSKSKGLNPGLAHYTTLSSLAQTGDTDL